MENLIQQNTKLLQKKKSFRFSFVFGRDAAGSYIMLAPMIIGFSLFTLYPLLWLVRWSFYDWDSFTPAVFKGLYNFIRAFTRDPDFWNSVANTFVFTFAKLAIEIPLALILAVLIRKAGKMNSIFRVAYFIPTVVSSAIIGLIFYFMFQPLNGIVNVLLMNFGLANGMIDWFGEKWHAIALLCIAGLWQGFGINMMFFLMGLQSIPEELYECADIDGASNMHKFFHITIPMLAPIMQVIIMLAMIGSMKMADLVLVLTNGQPYGQSEVAMTYVFKFFFPYSRGDAAPAIGYGAALAVITALILAIVTAIYTKLTSKLSKIY